MKRRAFITLIGGATASPAAWLLAAAAQPGAIPVIGFLSGRAPNEAAGVLAAFRKGLGEAGFVEGRNAAIEYRWAERHYDRLPDMMTELIRRQVAVVVATGGDLAPLAAKAATATIPIVFISGRDPIELGLVPRINRPGGNVTGVTLFALELEGKRFALLREIVPQAALIAVVLNPSATLFDAQSKDIVAAAHAVGQRIKIFHASNETALDTAFATAAELHAGAIFLATDPYFNSRQDQLIALVQRHSIPSIFPVREFAAAGALISYGTSFSEAYSQAGNYAGRILKGEKPADLPVVQPTKFELVINLKAAKALGLDVPDKLLALADEVIE